MLRKYLKIPKCFGGKCPYHFFRGVHARELEALAGFMDTIYGASVKGFGEDKLCWKLDREKGFLVKDYYSLLVGSNDYCFPWKSIWK